ncbi:hypothetical protein [Corynebacterium glutamicum]|uniref:hypothetical protein n=1 Tax=Corynebacterium glutamicum TaxID=1718 RepID=UPI0002FBB0F0|nr:hypothetical protein [Corynebacterium glutamicum]
MQFDYNTPSDDETLPERKERLRSPHTIQRLVIEAAMLKRLYALHNDFKAEVAEALNPGDSIKAKNAQALDIGTVTMSSPNNKAVPTDESILVAEAQERGMELVDRLPNNDTPEAVAIIDYLLEHAAHLLPAPTVSKDDLETIAKDVLEAWQETGRKPLGWEIKQASTPSISVRPGTSKVAKAAIDHIVGEVHQLLPETPQLEKKKEA